MEKRKIILKAAKIYQEKTASLGKIAPLNSTIRNFMIPRLLKAPQLVGIEITSDCNGNCIMCPRKKINRGIGTMDFSLYSKIIDECIAIGVKKILPYGYGESLILRNFREYINYIREKSSKVKIILATNGSLLTEEKALSIIQAKVNMVYITINGATQQTFENIERGLSLSQVEANIINLINLRNKFHSSLPYVLVGILDMPQTKHEIPEFIRKWEHIVDSVCIGGYSTRGGTVLTNFGKHILVPDHRPCFALWGQLTVCWTGNCALCCEDWNCIVNLGNLRNITLTEIWRSDKLNAIRELHLSHNREKIYPCLHCAVKSPWWWFK